MSELYTKDIEAFEKAYSKLGLPDGSAYRMIAHALWESALDYERERIIEIKKRSKEAGEIC